MLLKKPLFCRGFFFPDGAVMIENILGAIGLVVLLVLLYGAYLIVADRERAYAERQALRKQNKEKNSQVDKY
jgi:beta-lactamase regulating signal transducer with metallopeptidase domain